MQLLHGLPRKVNANPAHHRMQIHTHMHGSPSCLPISAGPAIGLQTQAHSAQKGAGARVTRCHPLYLSRSSRQHRPSQSTAVAAPFNQLATPFPHPFLSPLNISPDLCARLTARHMTGCANYQPCHAAGTLYAGSLRHPYPPPEAPPRSPCLPHLKASNMHSIGQTRKVVQQQRPLPVSTRLTPPPRLPLPHGDHDGVRRRQREPRLGAQGQADPRVNGKRKLVVQPYQSSLGGLRGRGRGSAGCGESFAVLWYAHEWGTGWYGMGQCCTSSVACSTCPTDTRQLLPPVLDQVASHSYGMHTLPRRGVIQCQAPCFWRCINAASTPAPFTLVTRYCAPPFCS